MEWTAWRGLDENVAAQLAAAFGLEDEPLGISIQDERSLSRNQDMARWMVRLRHTASVLQHLTL